MITITNQKEEITIKDEELKKDKKNLNFVGVDRYCEIVLSFVFEKRKLKKGITKIQKCQSSAGYSAGDMIKEYNNEVFSSEEVVLNDKDFKEVKKLIKNMNTPIDDKMKNAIVESVAIMMAFELFKYDSIDDFDYEDDFDFIFEYVCYEDLYYKEKMKYKDEIIERAKEIAKKEYKLDIEKKYNGGKE